MKSVVTEIREYLNCNEVEIGKRKNSDCGWRVRFDHRGLSYPTEKRFVIYAYCEYSGICLDLLDVLEWVRENKPELLDKF